MPARVIRAPFGLPVASAICSRISGSTGAWLQSTVVRPLPMRRATTSRTPAGSWCCISQPSWLSCGARFTSMPVAFASGATVARHRAAVLLTIRVGPHAASAGTTARACACPRGVRRRSASAPDGESKAAFACRRAMSAKLSRSPVTASSAKRRSSSTSRS